MSLAVADPPIRAATFQDRDEHDDHDDTSTTPSKGWALLEALAYAGALIDPSGALARQRFCRT